MTPSRNSHVWSAFLPSAFLAVDNMRGQVVATCLRYKRAVQWTGERVARRTPRLRSKVKQQQFS